MSYFVVYCVDPDEEIVEGDEVASTRGWADFIGWAASLDAPHLNYLAEYGRCFPGDAIAEMESELEAALRDATGGPSEDVLHVGRRLLAELRDRPDGAEAMSVTDGTGGTDGGEEGDEGGGEDE